MFTNIREVLTNEIGGRNLRNIMGVLGLVLRDNEGSAVIQSICKLAHAVARDQESVNKVLRSVVTVIMNVLSDKNAQLALEGLAEGLNIYFSQLTSEKVDVGIQRLKMYRENN